jgi:DMSO/TMAO reductase YedYZ molybdopterin-dependent catalytic subunit
VLRAVSLQTPGQVCAQASLPQSLYSDDRALLALRVNGADISIDHGYPARVILPNVAGELNTKWVRELRFEAA